MKLKDFTKYIGVFILAVLIIAVYKTFDSIGIIFGYIGKVLSLLTPVVWAFVIAFILYPVCVKIETFLGKTKFNFVRKRRRGIAVIVIFILFIIVVSASLSLFLPSVLESVTDFVYHLPSIIKNIQSYAKTVNFGEINLGSLLSNVSVEDIMGDINFYNARLYLDGVLNASRGVVNFFLSLVIAVYILLDRAGLINTARKFGELIFPEKSRALILKYLNRTFTIMYKYIYCQLLDALIVAILATLLLVIFRVRYAPVLGIFIGIFNLIPYFGAIIACAVTALLTVFTSSFTKGIWVAVLLILIQQTDANVIQPRLVRDALEIKPFWVLLGVSLGGGLFGIAGIILAVPAMALIKTLFGDYYAYRNIKKESQQSIPTKK